MKVYNGGALWSDLKGITPVTSESTFNCVITISTEDALSAHQAIAVFLDAALGMVDEMNKSQFPDLPEGSSLPDFPTRQAVDKILQLKGK